MKARFGTVLMIVGLVASAAACAHQAQRDAGAQPSFFESSVDHPTPVNALGNVERTGPDDDADRRGQTDKFLWDTGGVASPMTLDGGTDGGTRDAGPRSAP